jgi:outer membrane immunogenic protein
MIRKLLLAGTALITLTAGSAMAADMAVKAPYYKAPPAPTFSWTGIYFGADGGFGWTPSTGTLTTTATNVSGFVGQTPYSYSAQGAFGGGYIGGNYQFSWIVIGAEGDWQYAGTNLAGNNGANTASNILVSTQIKDYGSIRGRLGIAGSGDIFGRWMLFGTAGWAWGSYSTSYALDGFNPFVNNSVSASGWTAGFGLEMALTDNILIRGEYRYTSLGSSSFVNVPAGASEAGNKIGINDIRYGLAYKFGGDSAVVAKY